MVVQTGFCEGSRKQSCQLTPRAPVKRASPLYTMLRYQFKNTHQLLIYRPDGMKQESLQRTPRNSAEEPVKLLSDLVDHVLFIAREQACRWDS